MRRRYVIFLPLILGACSNAVLEGSNAAEGGVEKSYSISFDVAWAAVMKLVQQESILLGATDKQSGIASGTKSTTPSTLDMITSYSTRLLVFITVLSTSTSETKITVTAKPERRYEERDWRPDDVPSTYATEFHEKLTSLI